MIYWFSGTGNSRHAAQRLSRITGDRMHYMSGESASEGDLGQSGFGMVFPVYAWGVPPHVLDFVKRLSDGTVGKIVGGQTDVWVVMTYGDEAAMAPEMIIRAFSKRGVGVKAVWGVQMPNNYVLLPGFDVDDNILAENKVMLAEKRLEAIGGKILAKEWDFDFTRGKAPRLKSSIVWPLFRKWGIDVSKWKSTPSCVGCGLCAATCKSGNIKMCGGHPEWGKSCTSCLACYHICPHHAVQYGNATRKKGQYFFREGK